LDGVDFMLSVVDYFKIKLVVKNEDNLPDDIRKYVFVSNHPLGGLDGICLSAFIGERYNKKIRYLVNDLLFQIPNLQSIFVPVNKHGAQSKEAAKVMDEVYKSDNQIITFPAGLCSRKIEGRIVDLEWKKSFIQKSIEHKRDIVPIHFEGRNSNFFYRLANIRKRLGIKINFEMLYLPDEMFKNKNKTFYLTIGKPVPWENFSSKKKPVEWAQWMKEEIYKLGSK
jgi:putative hemolysin